MDYFISNLDLNHDIRRLSFASLPEQLYQACSEAPPDSEDLQTVSSGRKMTETSTRAGRRVRVVKYAGKLANITSMPLDIFHEIVSHLSPRDLLNIARASKSFNQLLRSRSSKTLWRAARSTIPGLPDCPEDLSEPEYARLVFEHDCYECSSSRAIKFEPWTRVRLCRECRPRLILSGEMLIDEIPGLTEELLSCIPSYSAALPEFHKHHSKLALCYYRHHAEMIVWNLNNMVQGLSLEEVCLVKEDFIAYHQERVRSIYKHSEALATWETSCKETRSKEMEELVLKRTGQITQRLEEVGYSKADFDLNKSNAKWRKLVCQPRELTDRIWKRIRPELEQVINDERLERDVKELRRRRLIRAREVVSFAINIIKTRMEENPIQRLCLVDALKLPTIVMLQKQKNFSQSITADVWKQHLPQIEMEMIEFTNVITNSLLRTVAPSENIPLSLTDILRLSRWSWVDRKFLNFPSTYFQCLGCGQRCLHYSKNLLCHRHNRMACLGPNIVFDPIYTAAAEIFIRSLPKGPGPFSERYKLDQKRFACCLCEEIVFMNWREMLAHFLLLGMEDPYPRRSTSEYMASSGKLAGPRHCIPLEKDYERCPVIRYFPDNLPAPPLDYTHPSSQIYHVYDFLAESI